MVRKMDWANWTKRAVGRARVGSEGGAEGEGDGQEGEKGKGVLGGKKEGCGGIKRGEGRMGGIREHGHEGSESAGERGGVM